MTIDTTHAIKVNQFIPIAEQQADAIVAKSGLFQEIRTGKGGVSYNHCFWSEAFHKAMNKLTSDAGLRICI